MAVSTLSPADVDLRTRVLQQLEHTPEVDAHDIGAAADGGVVTLTGAVATFPEKIAAEESVKRVVGVRALANDIEVKGITGRSDSDIARLALDALQDRVTVPTTVRAVVRGGYVVLEGAVTWMYQKRAAESAVSYLPGVRGVDNRIQLSPVVSPFDVKDLIDAALVRAANIDAKRIGVSAADGVVHLSGHVRSYLEKEEAERAAWGAAGVRKVVNNLQVSLPAH
jgi:osmotically-inducible protein OsmY